VLLLLLVLSSSLMYFAEHEAQPELFSSIPATMWWGIETLTTIGYGDIIPVTPLGRVLAGVIAVLGIGMFALPAGILGSAFVEEVQRRRSGSAGRSCPHCGQSIDS
jgi:voltage-gated potassium channel